MRLQVSRHSAARAISNAVFAATVLALEGAAVGSVRAQATGDERLTLRVLPVAVDVDAREYRVSGELFNRDDGRLHGMELDAALALQTPWGHWRVRAGHRRVENLVHYTGFTQSGLALVTQTRLQLQRSELGIERDVQLTPSLSASAGMSSQWQSFDRYILPGLNLPLQELLRERSVGVTLAVSAAPRSLAPHWAVPGQLGVEVSRFRTCEASLRSMPSVCKTQSP